MRARRLGDVRTRSPPAKIRDHRSEWRPDPYPRHHRDTRDERPPRSIQRLSPPEVERSQRVVARDRRSTSVERRDYTRRVDGGRDDGVRSRSPPFGQSRNRSHFDGEFLYRDSLSVEFQRRYLLPDPVDLNADAKPRLKLVGSSGPGSSRISKEKDFHGNCSSAFDERGSLVSKSLYLDAGTVRTFFTLPPDVGPTISSGKFGGNFSSSTSAGNLNTNLYKDEHQYQDYLRPDKISAKESYKAEEKPMLYSSDVTYPMVPLPHSKAFSSTSSGPLKDDYFGSYRDGPPLSSDGFDRSGGKFTDPFDHDGYGQAPRFASARDTELQRKDLAYYQLAPLNLARAEPRDYNYPELGRRERADPGYLSDELYGRMQPIDRLDYDQRDSLRTRFMDPVVDLVDNAESSRRNLLEGCLWDRPALQGESASNYLDMNRPSLATKQDGEFLGFRDAHLELGKRVSHDHEISHSSIDYGFGRDAGPGSYKERLKHLSMSECDPDMYRLNVSPERRLKAEDLGIYDPSERVLQRRYTMDEETNRHKSRVMSSSNRDTSSEVQELIDSDGQRNGEKSGSLLWSNRLSFRRPQYRKVGGLFDGMAHRKVSASDVWLSSQDLSVRVRGRPVESHSTGAGNGNIKKRLRPGPVSFHNSYTLDRRLNVHRPNKYWKRSQDDHHSEVEVQDGDPSGGWVGPAKSEPPENSEEFKQLVHRAFLKFSKQLNENSAQRRRYKEEGKAGSLFCCVCGSLSKEFIDMRRLVTHAFMSPKVGLRAEHLGLHRAICVLMGWNSVVAPGSPWVHQALPDADVLALKEDLILWPPLVIIHNSSIGNKNPGGRKVITIEDMEFILRDMGFGGGKTEVCRGKPANQSVMVVKFRGTFSGLQDAERLHKYYSENKRGRKEFQQINSNGGDGGSVEVGVAQVDKVELLLYGYMGIAEDLDKLDFEIKKRFVVKSKKEIQAIADAPLRTE